MTAATQTVTLTREDLRSIYSDAEAGERERFDKILNELAECNPPDPTPSTLRITTDQHHGLIKTLGPTTSLFEICNVVAVRQAVNSMRLENTLEKLAAANERHSKAKVAVRKTTAVLEDLEVDGGSTPVLEKQSRKLAVRLQGLVEEQAAAEADLARILKGRDWLKGKAPAWMQLERDIELSGLQSTCRPWLELGARRTELHSLEALLLTINRQRPGAIRDTLVTIYCREKLPDIFIDKGRKVVDGEKFRQHAAWLRDVRLPELVAEIGRLETEWNVIVASVEARIDRWVETGDLD